jgi:hypothetical protein
MSQEQLLKTPLCKLELSVERSPVWKAVCQLYQELEAREIVLRPHVWFSGEWFSPDMAPGIAIPFYLGNRRLLELERKFMLEAEGGTYQECMKILRHEAGHAIDTAYRLHRRKEWREVFGSPSVKYPDRYQACPDSRDFVIHLRGWYAQAHPAEDFAETFAVWLTTRSGWVRKYSEWPALKKLEYVDRLMKDIAGKPPIITSTKRVEPLSSHRITLGELYRERQSLYKKQSAGFYDRELLQIFGESSRGKANRRAPIKAEKFIRAYRSILRERAVRWTGAPKYGVNLILEELIERSKQLGLTLQKSEPITQGELSAMLAVQTMNLIHKGRYTFSL